MFLQNLIRVTNISLQRKYKKHLMWRCTFVQKVSQLRKKAAAMPNTCTSVPARLKKADSVEFHFMLVPLTIREFPLLSNNVLGVHGFMLRINTKWEFYFISCGYLEVMSNTNSLAKVISTLAHDLELTRFASLLSSLHADALQKRTHMNI